MRFSFEMCQYDMWIFNSMGSAAGPVFINWFKSWDHDRIKQTEQLQELLALLIKHNDERYLGCRP